MIGQKAVNAVIDLIKQILFHTPKEELDKQERKQISENGLVHFCNSGNVESILTNGVKPNREKTMKRCEREYTWFYIFDKNTIDEKMQIIHRKGKRKSYDAYVRVKGLTEQQMEKLRISRRNHGAVIYPGTLKTNDMSAKSIE